MTRIWIAALAVAILAGCSTDPISAEMAAKVPPNRLFQFAEQSDAKLVVTRDSGLYGSGVNFTLLIDGQKAAEFAAGEVATFGLTAGKHILGVQPATMFSSSPKESEITVKPGETVRRRLSLNGGYDLTPTAY